MKTLEEIKNEVAEIYLYHDFETALDLFQKGAISKVTFDGFVNQILVDACKEALKNASDKVNHNYFMYFERWNETVKKVSDEKNIPEL